MDGVFYLVTSDNFDMVLVKKPEELIGIQMIYSQMYGIELGEVKVSRVRLEVLEDE